MAYPPHVWRQIKNLTADDLCRALQQDGWTCEMKGGSARLFYRPGAPPRRVAIHYHPQKTFGAKMLQGLLESAGWTEADLYRLGLIR